MQSKKYGFRIGILLFVLGALIAIALSQRPGYSEWDDPKLKEPAARTQYMLSIAGVRQKPQEMGEALKLMIADASDLRKSLSATLQDANSFCFNQTFDQCSTAYVQRSLQNLVNQQAFSGKKSFNLTYNEFTALQLLKTIKFDLTRYPRLEEGLVADISRVQKSYENLLSVRGR